LRDAVSILNRKLRVLLMHARLENLKYFVLVTFTLRKLTTINHRLTQIMATQAELTAELTAKTAQIRKAIDEITTRLAALEEAVRNTPASPELTAAVAALGTAVQAADDIVPDAPPSPANPN
jgi:ABC-type Fe3+-hydroxamate transport system substrate-binding protein